MKRALAAMLLGAAMIAHPVIAADDSGKKPSVTKTKAARNKSLDPAKGDFHKLHNQKLGLACDACHSGQADVLFLRKDDAPAPGMPGQVNREVCLSCHKAPAKPAWYGATGR